MARFLDLDAVRQPLGTFKLGGTEYPVWPLRMDQLINLSVLEDQAAANTTTENQFQRLVLSLKEAIPDCPEDELLKIDMNQYHALTTWMRDDAVPGEIKNAEPEVAAVVTLPATTLL